jgi:hypothetical protein
MKLQKMQFCSVTFVLVEAILRELSTKVTHDSVTSDFCDHACRSDAQADAIAIDNCGLRQWEWNHRQTIDEDVVWRLEQGFDGQAHRTVARAEDIDPINLNRIDNANRPSDFGI